MRLRTGHKRAKLRRGLSIKHRTKNGVTTRTRRWEGIIVWANILGVSPDKAWRIIRQAYGRYRSRRPQVVDDKPPPF